MLIHEYSQQSTLAMPVLALLLLCALLFPVDCEAQVRAKRDMSPTEVRAGRNGIVANYSYSRRRKRGAEYNRRASLRRQRGNEGAWAIGVQGGATYAWQAPAKALSQGAWSGYAGVTATYRAMDWIHIRADINYLSKAYNILPATVSGTDDVSGNTLAERHSETYLMVPVMADWTFGSTVRSHIYTGAYMGGWLAGEAFTTQTNRFDGGFAGGVGVSWDVLPMLRVGADVMLYYSLSNTFTPDAGQTTYLHSLTMGLSAKYIF